MGIVEQIKKIEVSFIRYNYLFHRKKSRELNAIKVNLCLLIFLATEHHLGMLKAQLAKLRYTLLDEANSSGPKVC